jgi:hypothetical protein
MNRVVWVEGEGERRGEAGGQGEPSRSKSFAFLFGVQRNTLLSYFSTKCSTFLAVNMLADTLI